MNAGVLCHVGPGTAAHPHGIGPQSGDHGLAGEGVTGYSHIATGIYMGCFASHMGISRRI
jgi:hypothetical protein